MVILHTLDPSLTCKLSKVESKSVVRKRAANASCQLSNIQSTQVRALCKGLIISGSEP
jgi:hypothetical protein